MTWAEKRQIQYFSVFMTLAIIVVGIPLFSIYYEKPTCYDNKENGGELGVDCSGPCTRLCPAYVTKPVVIWQKVFQVEPGLYSAVAYIQNPNINAESYKVPYTFTFRDSANAVIEERKGTAYIPAGKNFAVFESGILLPKDSGPIRTSFVFDDGFEWLAASSTPLVSISRQIIDGISNTPSISVDIVNISKRNLGRVNIIAIVYDTEGNAVAASKTYVDRILENKKQTVSFTWPAPFSGQVTSCQQPTEVVLGIDRSGSMSSDGKNPPEPLTSVKNAALSFADGLSRKDRASVVSFATEASFPIDQILTDDIASVRDAISAITIASDGTQYTNIEDAIRKSTEELTSGRHLSTAKRAIVLLTDGEPTQPEKKGDPNYPSDMALAAARDAQSRDIEVYTIGLGALVNDEFLKSLAGLPERYFKAPRKDDLVDVYSKIGASMCKLGPAKVEIISDVLPE